MTMDHYGLSDFYKSQEVQKEILRLEPHLTPKPLSFQMVYYITEE